METSGGISGNVKINGDFIISGGVTEISAAFVTVLGIFGWFNLFFAGDLNVANNGTLKFGKNQTSPVNVSGCANVLGTIIVDYEFTESSNNLTLVNTNCLNPTFNGKIKATTLKCGSFSAQPSTQSIVVVFTPTSCDTRKTEFPGWGIGLVVCIAGLFVIGAIVLVLKVPALTKIFMPFVRRKRLGTPDEWTTIVSFLYLWNKYCIYVNFDCFLSRVSWCLISLEKFFGDTETKILKMLKKRWWWNE